MTTGYKLVVAAAILVSTFAGGVRADPLSRLAGDNATVRPAGPRSGTYGKLYFNVEGSANATNASYGVADFNFGTLALPVLTVNSVQLVLTEANAAYTAAGSVLVSLDQSTTLANIQSGTSPLAFDGAEPGTATDVSQGDLTLLGFGGGPFAFTTVGNVNSGQKDTYSLTLTPAIQTELTNRLNSGSTIRIVIGTATAGVAATWAGYTNTTYVGPTLNLDVTYNMETPANSATWGRIKALYR